MKQTIFQAEEKLGLVFDDENNPHGIIPREGSPTKKHNWKGLSRPRLLSTSGLIVGFYSVLIVVDVLIAFYFGL